MTAASSSCSSFLRVSLLQLVLVSIILTCKNDCSVAAQDCTAIDPSSGETPLNGAVSIIKGGNYYQLFETWAAPEAGLDITSYSSVGLDALSAANIIIGPPTATNFHNNSQHECNNYIEFENTC